MNTELKKTVEAYAQSCREEQLALLKTLGQIPAPSGQEDLRAEFCRDWLKKQGAEQVFTDDAKNVICELNYTGDNDLIVFAAHTDIVFPDREPLPLREEGGKLLAPGIGDDTANLVNLLLAAKYLIQNKAALSCGIIIAANSCEEGLGNLKGTKALFARYGSRIRGFYSFDLYMPLCCRTAVGSWRYKVSCDTIGGHSYGDFGNPSAIRILCGLINDLYTIQPPAGATYNVGRIEGGTTVNSIAQHAQMLYEFRSTSQSALQEMEQRFRKILEKWQNCGGTLQAELLGIRPGNGELDEAALACFTEKTAEIIRCFTGKEPAFTPCSTDSNIPLSLGIPANTIGSVLGGGPHTRQEWIDISSLPDGLKIVLSLMLLYKL